MDSDPEAWITQVLEGPLTFCGVDFVERRLEPSYHDETEEREFFQCLLCSSGDLKSPKSCLEHCQGRRHRRKYGHLVQRQQAWLHELQVPESFSDEHLNEDEDVPMYFVPFRRWHFGKWEFGLSCQLCGTAAFSDRYAIVDHCQSSRRHIVLRNRTLYTSDHVEISQNEPLLRRLNDLPELYKWHVERVLLRYIAAKEYSMASLASRRYEWFRVWNALQSYELRYKMSLLECSLWKANMLQFDEAIQLDCIPDLVLFLEKQGIGCDAYRQSRRRTSHANVILLGVIPFLRTKQEGRTI